MVKKCFYIFILVIFFTSLSSQCIFAAPKSNESASKPTADNNTVELKSSSAILLDTGRNQVLFSKNPDEKQHVSTACKLMTALVVLDKEKGKLNAKVTISKESVDSEGSALSLEVGEKYTVGDLLYGIMMTSANDAAKALSEYIGGDIPGFVNLMNSKASELNLKDTHFVNPTGLYDENQYTTAKDMATLISHAISDSPEFNKLLATQLKPWYTQEGKTLLLQNQNKLFWRYDGVDGGKTGYNFKDQITGVTTATRNNRRLICIVLNSPEDEMYEDTIKLLDYGFNSFKSTLLVEKGSPLNTVKIGDTDLSLVSDKDVYYVHPVGESYIQTVEFNIPEGLKPPIYKSTQAGTAKYILSDGTVFDISLYPAAEVVPPDSFYTSLYKKFKENMDIFILVIVLLCIEGILVLYNIGRLIVKLFRKLAHVPVSRQK